MERYQVGRTVNSRHHYRRQTTPSSFTQTTPSGKPANPTIYTQHMGLTAAQLDFLAETHLGTLTTIRSDGSPHVVAIAFTYLPEDGTVQIITNDGSRKVRNLATSDRAAVSQVDGRRWVTLEGPAVVLRDPASVAKAVDAFTSRYRTPSHNPDRVAIEITVDRVVGNA